MDIANLIIRVTNEGLDRATRELRRLQENAAGAQAANKKFGESIADLNKLALVGFGALTAVVGGSIKTAMSFESAMAEVNKTVDFTANYALSDLKKELEGLSKIMPLTFEELAAISAAGGQSGVAAEGLKDFTETIAKMAIAFDISAAETADAMAKISSSYNVPIENVKDLGDAINEVSNNGAVKANEIVDFMLRVGQSASNLNIAGEAAAALGGALIDAGGSVEVVGTAMKSIFTDMSSTEWLDSMSIILTDLGIDVKEYAKVVKTDGLAAFMMIREGIMSAENPVETLNTLFDAAGGNAASLFSEGSKVNEMLGSVGQVAGVAATHIGSLDKEYEAMANTTANAFVLMKNSASLVAAAIGEAFLPAVRDMTDSLIPMIQNMAAWAKENPELVVTIAKVAAAITGTIIVVAAISAAIGTAISIFTGLSAIFALVAGEAAILAIAISSPLVIIGLLIAAGIALYMNWDLVKKKASELGAWIATVWNKIKWDILQAVTGAKESAIAKFNELKTAAVNKMNAMADSIVNALKALPSKMLQIGKDIVMGLINGIKSGASGVASAIGSMASSAVAKAKSVLDIRSPSRVMKKVGEQTAEGMAVGIKKGAKAVKSEAQKMAESAVKAVQDGVAGLKRELALFGNDSALAALDYDIKVGKFGGANTGELRSLTEKLETTKRLADANKSVQGSIDGLIKQQALFGNSSSLASLMYDIEHTDKYKHATKELTDKLIEQTRAFEQLGMTAKATQAIQERFAKLKTDQEASGKAVDGVMGELQAETAIGKIQADYERRIEVIRKHEELTTGLIGSEEAKRIAIYESAQKAKELIQIQGNEKLFGELSSITKTFFGEQSAAHRAMFAVEKYFALKRILVENKVALAKAWASAAFPYNLPAVATVAAQTGLLAAAVKGFKSGGYTGNMGASQVAGVVHGQEYVFDAQSTKRIGVDNLNAMRSGKAVGGDVNITVNNMSSAKVETQKDDNGNIVMTIRDEIKRSWTNTGNPNSFESKQLNRNIQAPRRR